ncbi:Phosphonoacetaldehyde reductase [subsurface metagenome]
MQSALIIHSKHTRDYAKRLLKKYKNVKLLEITKPPTKEILKIKNDKNIVVGIGGGSVIDVAKIISKDKRCIAIPTTAAGAAMTSYATVWGREKITIPTKKPILKMDYDMPKNLPFSVRQSTTFDALSHAIESFWSKNATLQSKKYSKEAIYLINKYLNKINHDLNKDDINKLITAGNLAGQAIAIATTNVVHAVSYPITVEYGIDHGTACGMLLPYFVEYMDFEELPELFSLDSTEKLVVLLKRSFIPPKIKDFDIKLIARMAIRYDKANQGPKKISKREFEEILRNVKVS